MSRAHFVAGGHRLPCACVDLLTRAKGGLQRGGARVLAEDGDCVVARNSHVRSGGQRSWAELFTSPCASQSREAPKEARAASKARSHPSKAHGRTKICPSLTNNSSQDAGDQGALDCAKYIALFSSTVGDEHSPFGQSGDRVRLVLPLGPGRGLREVRSQSLTDDGSFPEKLTAYKCISKGKFQVTLSPSYLVDGVLTALPQK